jgi:hypothetical protein
MRSHILGSRLIISDVHIYTGSDYSQSLLDHLAVQSTLSGKTLLLAKTSQYAFALERRQKLGLIRPVVDHPDGRNGDDDGKQTLNDELK